MIKQFLKTYGLNYSILKSVSEKYALYGKSFSEVAFQFKISDGVLLGILFDHALACEPRVLKSLKQTFGCPLSNRDDFVEYCKRQGDVDNVIDFFDINLKSKVIPRVILAFQYEYNNFMKVNG